MTAQLIATLWLHDASDFEVRVAERHYIPPNDQPGIAIAAGQYGVRISYEAGVALWDKLGEALVEISNAKAGVPS